ncbi:MAG: hypothetical protein ABFC67_07070 [Mizugakiibacter sp.]|uniref:hypothetical protein n=1 Tax=Mizugakiibacter sp. TaxID=1972610 RepID=UPI0031C59EC6|nr:hypothetical protein [Xanthomonadaceae bacterium]
MSQRNEGAGARMDRALELVAVFVLVTSFVGLSSTLAGYFLAPQVWIVSVLVTGTYAWRTHARPSALGPGPRWQHLALLVLVALFFRLPAYQYVLGGQDQGLYVNIANYIERTGGVEVRDTVLDRLDDSAFKDEYLRDNRGRGVFVAGVYARDGASPRLEFQFYHLFPVWMALFGGVFGATFGVYALTLFALLSILFFHRLTLVVTRSHAAALAAGLLLALSPLHAFFSKFPVTEVPTLAFSLIGFTYLAACWSSTSSLRQRRWLWISVAAFAALFTTRISGLMYMPFVVAAAVAAVSCDPDDGRRRVVVCWAVAVVGLYLLSVVYGLHWSYYYATDIYRIFFAGPLGAHWPSHIVALAVLGIAFWFGLTMFARRPGGAAVVARWLVVPVRSGIAVVVLLGLAIGLFKIYRLGWTAHYATDPWLSTAWGLAGSGWRAARASSLAGLAVYLGPLIPLVFMFAVLRRQADPRIEFLRVFIAGFFVYTAILQWTIPYGPYYARYLLSELVPYMILFVVCCWAGMPPGRGRIIVAAALALSTAYAGATTMSQIGKRENDGLYAGLRHLVSRVDSADVILLDSLGPGLPNTHEIKTPLVYTFGLSVVAIDDASLDDASYVSALNSRYDDVYLISPNANPPRGFAPIDSTRIRVWAFRWGYGPPVRIFLREDMRLYMHRLERPMFPFGTSEYFHAPGAWNSWLASGWSNPEAWGVWSIGKSAQLQIDPRQLPERKGGIALQFAAQAFITPKHPRQTVRVSVNGSLVNAYTVTYPNNRVRMSVPLSRDLLDGTRKIVINFDLPDATSPKAVSLSNDMRVLALGLVSVTAMDAPSDQSAAPSADRLHSGPNPDTPTGPPKNGTR